MTRIFVVVVLLLISSLILGTYFGFSVNEGIWVKETFKNVEMRIGYPYSSIKFFKEGLLSFEGDFGYSFANEQFIGSFGLFSKVEFFSFKSFIKITFHNLRNVDGTTEIGRMYFGINPEFQFKNTKTFLILETSTFYLYYDPSTGIDFGSIFNSDDIFRYKVTAGIKHHITPDIELSISLGTNYKWVPYLSFPILGNEFFDAGIVVKF
ncbi:hypothetical protein JYK00_04745 [Thermosipho ferrireducens]|uniref:Outer membrane protein beta-barrel domain-containing protein n=1 Tax=Thermosipho ferrireducens TaxID=2571116 RepID=A0ABX7S894_9BACT|nr:hypothetical protein [Thermosipho ferrireducens]QTA38818.1 hypothetical protein JYK00_04745 [Thermosipho ferrireducens]